MDFQDKSPRQLVSEAMFHWRNGGLHALAFNGIGFVRKRVQRCLKSWPRQRSTRREIFLKREFEKRKPWATKFIINGQEYGGDYDTRTDPRVGWFFQAFPNAQTILDLGSLEGAQAFQLAERPTVRSVLGIEGRQANFERAEFVRQVLGITKVKFILADLETADLPSFGQFDAVFCAGILYHMPKPWELIKRISHVSKNVFIWTHYAPEDRANVTVNGYKGMWYQEFGLADPWSGLSPQSFWPTQNSLMEMIRNYDFDTINVIQDAPDHPHGPVITLAVMAL